VLIWWILRSTGASGLAPRCQYCYWQTICPTNRATGSCAARTPQASDLARRVRPGIRVHPTANLPKQRSSATGGGFSVPRNCS